MAKSGKSPSYHQKLRDEKRGEEIRKDNRGIVQIIGALLNLKHNQPIYYRKWI